MIKTLGPARTKEKHRSGEIAKLAAKYLCASQPALLLRLNVLHIGRQRGMTGFLGELMRKQIGIVSNAAAEIKQQDRTLQVSFQAGGM